MAIGRAQGRRLGAAILLGLLPWLAAGAWAANRLPGPELEAIQAAAADTDFLWYGHLRDDADLDSAPEAVLFVAIDSSWLLFERGGEVSSLGPSSQLPDPGRRRHPGEPLDADQFRRHIAIPEARERSWCSSYSRLRASLEKHWEARRLWHGAVAMEPDMRLELFNAADGAWALVVHHSAADRPERGCVALHGFGSRLVRVRDAGDADNP